MCGIAAILSYAPGGAGIDMGELLAIRDAMRLRGPDGCGSWLSADGRVGLAHRRLSIIDLSDGGAQPMVDELGRAAITFNGEIYNYRDLRTELEQQGVIFRSRSDTEVLLRLYLRDGPAMLGALRGMFAFAIWDARRQGLFAARDPFGIKPLYVADDGRVVRLASQVKALLAGGRIDTAPDPAGHAGFFLWGSVPEPHTLYQKIAAVPAGGWLWIDRAGTSRQGRFFDLAGEIRTAARARDGAAGGPAPGSGEARRLVRSALAETVSRHLMADVPVGVFLSAGFDSATLAALATEALGPGARPLETLTLGFAEFVGTAADEVPLAEEIAQRLGTRQTTRRITAEDFRGARDQILTDMDQPSIDGVNTWLVARAAREAGLTVALSGLGGDELFAGYDTFAVVPGLVRRLRPFARVPWVGRLVRQMLEPIAARLPSPKAAGLLEYGGRPGGAYLLRRGLFMPWELGEVMDPDMARAGLDALRPVESAEAVAGGIGHGRLMVSALEMSLYMRNQLLRDADWAGMAHSLEIRVPLVDVGLFRALLPLLVNRRPPVKLDLATAPERPLPPAVLKRKKTGFSVPVAQWMGLSGREHATRRRPSLRDWARFVHAHVAAAA